MYAYSKNGNAGNAEYEIIVSSKKGATERLSFLFQGDTMTIKEYKAVEKAQEKCRNCVFLERVDDIFYCPFKGCIHK